MPLLGHSDLHIWDNAAFDVSGCPCPASPPLLPHPRSADENLSPNLSTSPLSSSVVVAGKKKQPPPSISTPKQDKPLKLLFKQGLLSPARRTETDDDESIVNSEIESILKEISRLSERLEALRSRKKDAHRKAVPVNDVEGQYCPHGEEVIAAAATTAPLKQSTKTNKTVRVCSPPETAKPRARGVSMCPSEIHGGIRLVQLPQNWQSRRKSCFWKLPPPLEEEEANVGKVRAHRLSLASGAKNGSRTLSPKSRQSKLTDLRRGIVTVGSKSNKLAGKKEEAAPSRLQPKKLFGDANPPAAPKPLKNARVVPSRYNQIPTIAGRAAAARNSPEKERRQKKEMKGKSQGRPVLMGAGDASGRTKRWGASESERSSVSSCTTESLALEEVAVALPKIKAVRLVGESPRDSGCAKRAADLAGKRAYFSCETAAAKDDGDSPICQVLDYDDDDDDDACL